MNVQHNPPRRTALVWTGIIIIGIIIIFIPAIIGMDGFQGGFALSFLGGFIALIGIIAAVIYFRLAATLDKITHPENVLAHWQYTPEEWKIYTEIEHKEDATGRKNLFLLIAVITVFVGILFWVVVRDNPVIIILICLGIIAITGLAAWISGLTNYRNNKNNLGEAYIALDGVFLNRQLHVWKGIGNSLEEIVYETDEQGRPRVRIEYSSPSRDGRNAYTVRIPVPAGQEGAARKIVTEIVSAHLHPSQKSKG
jgi:hypothetical protein